MNARIYASLFSRKDRIKFIGFSILFLFIAFLVSISKRQGRAGTDVGFLIVLPVLGFGGILAEVWNRPLQRPTTALLPALQRTLFPWYIRLFLAVALVWAVMIHWVEPGIPLAAAVGISAGMFALPIPSVLYRNRPAESKLRRILFLFLGIIIGGNGVTLFARNQLLTHASL